MAPSPKQRKQLLREQLELLIANIQPQFGHTLQVEYIDHERCLGIRIPTAPFFAISYKKQWSILGYKSKQKKYVCKVTANWFNFSTSRNDIKCVILVDHVASVIRQHITMYHQNVNASSIQFVHHFAQ